MSQDTKEAVMAVIKKDDRFLLIKRGRTVPAAGFWQPVSGKIKEGETQREAVAREVREELGMEAAAVKKVHESMTSNRVYRLHWWTTRILSGQPAIMNPEVEDFQWLAESELRKLHPVFDEHIEILSGVNEIDFQQE